MASFLIKYRDASGYRDETVHTENEGAARELWNMCHDDGFITDVRRIA